MQWEADEIVEWLPNYDARYVTLVVPGLKPVSLYPPARTLISNDRFRSDVEAGVLAFEEKTGIEILVQESGWQADLGGAECVMTYVLDAAVSGIIGAYATDLRDSVVRALKSRSPRAPITEQRVKHHAKILVSVRHNVSAAELTVRAVTLRGTSASVSLSGSDGSSFLAELEFNEDGTASLTSSTHTFP